jgi:hypothetical protein
MFKDNITLTGRLIIKKFNDRQELVYKTEVENLVVTSGKQFIASRLIENTFDPMSHMAIGDSPTASALTQTTLVNELSRVALYGASITDTSATFTATFPAGSGTGDIVEAGIFNDSMGGVMLCRTTFPVITKNSLESIAIEWIVSVG